MANRISNLIKKAKENQRKQAIKEYHSNNRTAFLGLFCIFAYAITFSLLSMINDTVFFSTILALFSFATTLGFELVDWIKYKVNKSSSKPCFLIQSILKYHTNVLLIGIFIFLVIVTPFCIYAKCDASAYKEFTLSINSHIPNIITSFTFSGYFISFYLRNFFINRDAFLSSLEK